MSRSTERIIVAALVALVIVGLVWFRNGEPASFGPCVQLNGTNNEIPIYYRVGEASFTTYSSPQCSSESRITV
jgi:hypothetical protein